MADCGDDDDDDDDDEDWVVVGAQQPQSSFEALEDAVALEILGWLDGRSLSALRLCSKRCFELVERFRSVLLLSADFCVVDAPPGLLSLPAEALALVLACLEIPALCALAQTCRALRAFVCTEDFVHARDAFRSLKVRAFHAALRRPIAEDVAAAHGAIRSVALAPIRAANGVAERYMWNAPAKWLLPVAAVSAAVSVATMPVTIAARMAAPVWAQAARRRSDKRRELSVWQRDEDAPQCTSCGLPFSALRRRHHCRCCRRVFCAYCLPHTLSSPQLLGYQYAVRVCVACHACLVRGNLPMSHPFQTQYFF